MIMMMMKMMMDAHFVDLTFSHLWGPVEILVLACPVGIDAKANAIQREVCQHIADIAVHIGLLVGT